MPPSSLLFSVITLGSLGSCSGGSISDATPTSTKCLARRLRGAPLTLPRSPKLVFLSRTLQRPPHQDPSPTGRRPPSPSEPRDAPAARAHPLARALQGPQRPSDLPLRLPQPLQPLAQLPPVALCRLHVLAGFLQQHLRLRLHRLPHPAAQPAGLPTVPGSRERPRAASRSGSAAPPCPAHHAPPPPLD